jgi:hypothetical protein
VSPHRSDRQRQLHEQASLKLADDDRGWFEQHPGESVRHRPAGRPEFCGPNQRGCVLAFKVPALPGTAVELWVEVRWLAPGFRTRPPVFVLDPGGSDGHRRLKAA